MALNEAFLETATVRDNIVRIAKQLNYTPRSIKAPRACLKIQAQTTIGLNGTTYPEFATLLKGDVFVANNDNDNFTFTLTQDIQVAVDSSTGIATFDNVLVYQGNLDHLLIFVAFDLRMLLNKFHLRLLISICHF